RPSPRRSISGRPHSTGSIAGSGRRGHTNRRSLDGAATPRGGEKSTKRPKLSSRCRVESTTAGLSRHDALRILFMHAIDRRSFLGTSVRGLAAALAAGPTLLGRLAAAGDDAHSRPDTLFLTWQRDPTTTMTVQWVGTEVAPPDVHVCAATDTSAPWSNTHSTA